MSESEDSDSELSSAYKGTRMGEMRLNGRPRANSSLPIYHDSKPEDRRNLGMWDEDAQPTIWDAVNYPQEQEFQFESFYLRYDRQPEARAIIDKPVDDTWQEDPKVVDLAHDDEDDESSDFEEDVQAFFEGEHTRRKPIHRLKTADKLGRLGKHSLLVIGTADAKPMDQPLQEGDLNGLSDLYYLAAFGEDRIIDIETNSDMGSERFRMPKTFEVITQELEDENVNDEEYQTEIIHHSRVIHIPEGTLEDDLRGTPAMKPVFHELLNIDKIRAASGEGFWRAGYQGMLVQPPEDPSGRGRMQFSDDSEGVQEEIEAFLNNFKRTIATTADVSGLDMTISNPQPHLQANYEAIAAALDLPKSILTGEDRADTASSEDVRQWHQKVGERRNSFAEPVILEPLIQKFIKFGILSEPEGEGFKVEWQPLDELTEQQEADLKSTKANAFSTLSGGRPTRLGSIGELRQLFGWGPEIGSEVDEEDTIDEDDLQVDEDKLPDNHPLSDGDEQQQSQDGQAQQGEQAQGQGQEQSQQQGEGAEQQEPQSSQQQDPQQPNGGGQEANTVSRNEFNVTANAYQYEAGDPVDTPDGKGVVVEAVTSVPDHDEIPDDLEASEDSPLFAVAMKDMRHGQVGGVAFYSASEIEMRDTSVDPDEAIEAVGNEDESVENAICNGFTRVNGDWNPPESWRESNKPARLIALDVFTTLNGDFNKCTREFDSTDGITDVEAFCGAFFDYIFGHTYWRGDSVLPGN